MDKLPKTAPEYDFRKRDHLADAKRNLFLLLHNMNSDDMSDIDVELLYQLSLDDSIQSKLRVNEKD